MWSLRYGVEIWRERGANASHIGSGSGTGTGSGSDSGSGGGYMASVRVLPAPAANAINEIRSRIFPNPEQVVMSKSSSVFLIGLVVIESLCLDGDLTFEAAPETSITVRAITRSQVRVDDRLGSPQLNKESSHRRKDEEVSYLQRISTFPVDGTSPQKGEYIFNGHSLLPASVVSDDDQYTGLRFGHQGVSEHVRHEKRRYDGVHTPFQHCCCVHMAMWCDEECLTCADSCVD